MYLPCLFSPLPSAQMDMCVQDGADVSVEWKTREKQK